MVLPGILHVFVKNLLIILKCLILCLCPQLSDLHKKLRTSVSDQQLGVTAGTKVIEPLLLCPARGFMATPDVATKDKSGVKKHRRTSSNVSLGPPSPLADTSQTSRRLRLIDFLADTRVIQRFIMVSMVINRNSEVEIKMC